MAYFLCVSSVVSHLSSEVKSQWKPGAENLLCVLHLSVSSSPSASGFANMNSPWIISLALDCFWKTVHMPVIQVKQFGLYKKINEWIKLKFALRLIWSTLPQLWLKCIWTAVAWLEMVIFLASCLLLFLASQHKHLLCLPNIKQQSLPALLLSWPSWELMTHQAH